MKIILLNQRIEQLEHCQKEMFGSLVISFVNAPMVPELENTNLKQVEYYVDVWDKETNRTPIKPKRTLSFDEAIRTPNPEQEKRRASALLDELLVEIYNNANNGTTDYYSTSGKSQRSVWLEVVDLHEKDTHELLAILSCLRVHVQRAGSVLARQLKRRDALRRRQQVRCDVIDRMLHSFGASDSVDMKFTIRPTPSESGFSQWVAAMKMVAQLPGGIPPEFRRRLWLTMAERHLASRNVNWPEVEKSCFSEWSHPEDGELGIQIVKDLHRTGCSLFCGKDNQENQALLKKVLLAYARWNKAVGYCQGFNMLAALLLQVTDRCESEALKLMIYLIEGVLPDSYFADSLRGLSVDMAVFRELLRSKLPRLSKHLDLLQTAAKDGSRSYEPPLTNVFTMQWFLTLFCNCLPQPTVLRVWDLIFLEGNEILLRTALAIWQVLAQRILEVRTADEFYCLMGVLTRELLESNLIDANTLIKAIVTVGPLTELKSLRDHYLYNITPWGTSVPQNTDRQVSLYPKTIPLDISALKKQYVKLKQRQRQAHIIFSAAISRQPSQPTPIAMNHLLLGKNALVPSKRPGPLKGSIPPARQAPPSTIQWKDTQKQTSSSSSSDTELCDDDVQSSSEDEQEEQAKESKEQVKISVASASKDNLEVEDTNRDSLSASPINVKFTSDSEDDNSEFEHFLADRVSGLKQEELRLNTRRNSEKALQIIQENSLILHRIMQCQSRLSPSPPPFAFAESSVVYSPPPIALEEDITEPTSSLSSYCPLENGIEVSKEEKMDSVSSWIENQNTSRYHSILEKSKSLDERYNNLITQVNKDLKQNRLGGLHESKSETPVGSNIEDILTPICQDDINFFDPLRAKTDSEETITSASKLEDSISNKLIKENLDLLRICSVSKAKESAEKSKKLIEENVSLLESISSEKNNIKDSLKLEESNGNVETILEVDKEGDEASGSNFLNFEEFPGLTEKDIQNSDGLDSFPKDISNQSVHSLDLPIRNCLNTGGSSPETHSAESETNQSKIHCDKESKSFDRASPCSYLSRSLLEQSFRKSPNEEKSPSHIFNPFPINLSSRQNKEVALKLGLYKKSKEKVKINGPSASKDNLEVEDANRDSLSASPINLKFTSDSEDDNSEFEHFLTDRVSSLKQEELRLNTRRNSEKALQIIQENSLILHRIMQCQSRLSPSPPPFAFAESSVVYSPPPIALEEDITEPTSSLSSYCPLENGIEVSKEEKMDSVSSWIENQNTSKYHSILEKSKNLDERYNNLITQVNKDLKQNRLGGLHESKSETPVGSNIEDILTPICQDDINFFDPLRAKTDSEETITSASKLEDSISNKLIKENLDLLRICSVSKAKESAEKSKKLIEENVSLLESISSKKSNIKDSLKLEESNGNVETIVEVYKEGDEASGSNLLNFEEFPGLTGKDIQNSDDLDSFPKDISNPSVHSLDLPITNCINTDGSSPETHSAESETNQSKIHCDKESKSFDRASPCSYLSRSLLEQSFRKSPNEEKSPSHIFNPFPINLSSRQNKEVALKLGLYKK
ncbi:LOW QUALITY PROTEIN: uncharacterized protein LOC115886662 [Sitophilus oryzae]|uniref:TBC1 domain family member 30 n=1 Tax=Sitophilus oryzae TaxID=7048 RepID=A0A6J2YEE2_SITOR|nr:LOW QUALITY PROTEIN: uncharacterized protein LOC115886662 [Sitophilus oryzae]